MLSNTNSLVKHCIKRVGNQYNVRLISSNAIIRGSHDSDDKKENLIIRKLTELNEWYIKFTGLDEIKRLQDRVILTQEKLEKAQEERREIGKILVDIRKKSVELQEQLHNIKRWENTQRFLELTTQETEVMKQEKELSAKFEILDKAEREIFTSLSNAVRDSHEKEKAQSEYTKYWGIILSIFGTIVGAVVSTLISTIRNKQIVNGINKGVEEKFFQMTGMIKNDIKYDNQDKTTQSMVTEIKNEINDAQKQLSELIKKSNTQNSKVVAHVKDGDNFIDVNELLSVQTDLLERHQTEIINLVAERNKTGSVKTVSGESLLLFGGAAIFIGFILGKIS